jgi:hypothetical protein
MVTARLPENRFNELISFIRDKSGEHKMIITRDTLLENDLGITGDDAAELIEDLSERFQFDTSGFNFKKYFNDEPFVFLSTRRVEPFTIGHLEKAILFGRLDEDVISSLK